MASTIMKAIAMYLLVTNFCMYVIIGAICGWVLDKSIDHTYITNIGQFGYKPVYLAMGNEATGFLVIFALIASVVGAAACISSFHHMKLWRAHSLVSTTMSTFIAWGLTLLAMGLACKEIHIGGRNAKLITVESFLIILSATQLIYVAVINMGTECEDVYSSGTAVESHKASPHHSA